MQELKESPRKWAMRDAATDGRYRHGDAPYHGKKAKEYGAWQEMHRRCSDPKRPCFKNYGARGITVCAAWSDYSTFLADMGRAPSRTHTLERIDNARGYSKENCRWATKLEQAQNKRNVRLLEFNGLRLSLPEWARRIGICRESLRDRLALGWPVERALTEPKSKERA